MKTFKNIFLLFCSFLLLFSSCKKELPSITQEGAGTFGCLINGNVFILPMIQSGQGIEISSDYYNNNLDTATYYFDLSARLKQKKCSTASIEISSSNIKIQVAKTYILESEENGKISATALIKNNCKNLRTSYITTKTVKGEFKFTRFDYKMNIVSGTFWFDAINSNGEKIEVREGRFDTTFR